MITTTKAKDIARDRIDKATSAKVHSPIDPFDDRSELTVEQRELRRVQTKQALDILKINTSPITEKVPAFVPANVPLGQLQVPETLITKLDNGIRVVSQETYGQMTTIGVLTNVGSRHEHTPGIVHFLETTAFGSTTNMDALQISNQLQDWGGMSFANHNREQTLHCIDILRPNVHLGMGLLAEVILQRNFADSEEEFYNAMDALAFQARERVPRLLLAEALQVAAYGSDQQLGKLHFATPETLPLLSPQLVQAFYNDSIRNNPQNMVVAGAGISHDTLVDLANDYFGQVAQKSAPTTVRTLYRGGSHQIPQLQESSIFSPTVPEEDFCHVALAFPVEGWHSDSMVTACVLQILLGGGSSFSAGGPGKGMYSRMYQQVLNRSSFLDSAEAFTSFADETGLFGVMASTAQPSRVRDTVIILAKQLAILALKQVSEIELARARNMLKCNVLTQLESRLVIFEDMGRQVLTYGKRENAAATCAKIDAVTAEDIQRLVQNMLKENPTIASAGSHLSHVPSHDEVSRLFWNLL